MARTKHALAVSRHTRMMIGLGFKGGMRNYATYFRKLESSKRWNKAHSSVMRAANQIYFDKIQAEMGNQGRTARPFYAINHAAERLQKRKDRANEARKALLRLQYLRPNRRGGGSASPLTLTD